MTQRGLLFVEKLDYLQLRAVAAAVRSAQDRAARVGRRMRCSMWLLKRYRLARRHMWWSYAACAPHHTRAACTGEWGKGYSAVGENKVYIHIYWTVLFTHPHMHTLPHSPAA